MTVVIPCYAYERYLGASVASALSQDGVQVDVLIVDDASPDRSADVAREIAAAEPRVRAILHPTNQGHIATYNDGLGQVNGSYVVLLSADDLLTPGSLSRSVALLEAHPEVGLVYGHAPAFAAAPPRARTTVRSWSIWPGEAWIEQLCRSVTNPVPAPTAVMRSSLLRDLVGYDPRLPHSADLLMWLRAASRAAVGRVNGADQAFYRVHGGNMHVQQFGTALLDIVERHRAFETLFEGDRAHLARVDHLRRAAQRSLAREALAIASQAAVLARYRHECTEQLVTFAEELSPPRDDPALWSAFERRRASSSRRGSLERGLEVLVDDLHGRIRWRRWRRSGLYTPVRPR